MWKSIVPVVTNIAIFCFYISCDNRINQKEAKQFVKTEYLASITENWKIEAESGNIGRYRLFNSGKAKLRTGESVFLEFIKPKFLKDFQLIDDSAVLKYKTLEFKLYLNEIFAGKFAANKKVTVNKNIESIRFILVKTGNERIVHGWDQDYDYLYIKDTSAFDVGNQYFNLSFNKNLGVNFISAVTRKSRSNTLNKDKATLGFEFTNKRNILILSGKKSKNVFEQIVYFHENGNFFIHDLKANKENKNIIYDYFFYGNWTAKGKVKNKLIIELTGNISGLRPDGVLDTKTYYNLKATIDSLGALSSNELINNVLIDLPDKVMVKLGDFNDDFIIDIPYATDKNITGIKLYSCNKCFLRYRTVRDLLKAQQLFKRRGLRIKLLDCYRPFDIQKLLYDAFPLSGYVADPVGGSIHNRGTAVDLTLVDKNGKELNMGTKYDDLTVRSNHGYIGFPDTVLQNRKLLRETMNTCNFVTIRLEWWHYNHQYARKYPKLNDQFPCGK